MSKGHMEALAALKAKRKVQVSSLRTAMQKACTMPVSQKIVTGHCPTCGKKIGKSAVERQQAARAQKPKSRAE